MDVEQEKEDQLGDRVDELLDVINKQNETINKQNKVIDELMKNQEEQNKNQNEKYYDLKKKTEELQAQIGDASILQDLLLVESNQNNGEEMQHLLSSDHYNTSDITRDAVVFDIPTFFCCILRFIYLLTGCTTSIIGYFRVIFPYRGLVYVTAIAKVLSITFEIFTERIKEKIIKVIFILNVVGVIFYWLINFLPISFLTGGFIVIVAEMIISIYLTIKKMPKMLILSHACDGLVMIFGLLSAYIGSIIFVITFCILLFLSSIFLLIGLPVTKQTSNETTNQNSNDLIDHHETENQNDIQTSDNDINDDSHNNFQNSSSDSNLEMNSDKSLVDILLHHHQQLKSHESQNQTQITHFTYNNLQIKPKALNNNWTTQATLSPDVYTMMMLSHWTQKSFRHPCNCCKKNSTEIIIPRPSKSWILGSIVFIVQTLLALMTLLDQINVGFGETTLDIPVRVTSIVRIGQFLTLILAIMTQTDLLVSFRILLFLSYKKDDWLILTGHHKNERSYLVWFCRILLPNLMKTVQGLLVLVITFIVIVQSDNILDLLKDFTALLVISMIDDMFFFMADHGYLGESLSKKTNKAKEVSIDEDDRNVQCYLHVFLLIFILVMFGGWIAVVIEQQKGTLLLQQYLSCPENLDFELIGDGKCDAPRGVEANILECGEEDGDCVIFNQRYPDCIAENPSWIGDGDCDGGLYNTLTCGWDGGDCEQFNEIYPNCTVELPSWIGDGWCDDSSYNITECGWDGGDCLD